GAVFRPDPLLEQIANHEREPPDAQIDGVARRAADLVHDAVVEDVGGCRPALDVVADPGVVRVARPQGEALRADDVDIVRLPIAEAVRGELRALDDDLALRPSAREQAGLVVVQIAAAHGQADSLAANPGSVAMGAPRPRELDVLDGRVPALNDPDALVFGKAPACPHVRASADAADGEVVLRPDRDVVFVERGRDLDHVAVPGDLRGFAGHAQGAAGADQKYATTRSIVREHESDRLTSRARGSQPGRPAPLTAGRALPSGTIHREGAWTSGTLESPRGCRCCS